MLCVGYGNVGVDFSGWMIGVDCCFGVNGFVGYVISQVDGLGCLVEFVDQGCSYVMEVMFYSGVVKNVWYVVGCFGVGYYCEMMCCVVQLGSFGVGVVSNINGCYGVVYGESGYCFGVGGMYVMFYVNLQYVQICCDVFSEIGGSGFGLKMFLQIIVCWQVGIGLCISCGWMLGNGLCLEWIGYM